MTDSIKAAKSAPAGIAVIILDDCDNGIIGIKGANEQVDADYIDSVASKLLKSDLVLLQNEIPINTVE